MTTAIEKRTPAAIALAEYEDFNLENMQKEAAALPSGSGSFFKPHQGKNVIRMLPAPKGRAPWFTYHKHHFSIGKERKNVICAKYQYNQPCPLCQKAMKLRATGNKIDARKAKALDPSSQVYMNIVDMKNPEKGVQLWTMSPSVFKGIMDAIDTAGVSNPAHPIKGFNIAFIRTGEGLDTRYKGYAVAREMSELPGWEELLPTQMNLAEVEAAPSDEDIEAALDGEFEEREPFKKESKGKSAKADADASDDADSDIPY
jgi:hypothetical protein